MKTLQGLAAVFLLATALPAFADAPSLDFVDHAQRPRVQCEAQNLRGKAFFAVGRNPVNVQRKALTKCLKHSAQCHVVGCRPF